MKVLIIGEFSGFAKNLSAGINSIEGNEAVVFAYEDGFKKIVQEESSFTYRRPYNINIMGIELKGTHYVTGYSLFTKFKRDIKRFSYYFDAVFIISYTLIRLSDNHFVPLFSIEDILSVCKNKDKIFMSSCGGDIAFNKFAIQDKRFSEVYRDYKFQDNSLYEKQEQEALKIVKGVIPMSYQYHEAYRLFGSDFNLLPPIQLPFISSSVPHKHSFYKEGKIVIFNGALRSTKGTVYIESALKRIEEKYGDRIIIRNDRMPYAEFLNFLQGIDIYIDLCTDYDYGMSAIAAMLAGCVVLSGNEPETRNTIGTDDIPVLSASPNPESIYNTLEYLITHPEKIEIIGRKSIAYAMKYHDSKYVAQKYLEAFGN